jgi:ferredoxin
VKIVLDYDKCSGNGICESIAPEYYHVADDGDLVLLKEQVSDQDIGAIRRTVAECPTGALTLAPQ